MPQHFNCHGVHGLSGLFRAVSAVEPSLFCPLPPLSPSLISHLASVDVKQSVLTFTGGYVSPHSNLEKITLRTLSLVIRYMTKELGQNVMHSFISKCIVLSDK